jgi:type II secretory pathway component PulF
MPPKRPTLSLERKDGFQGNHEGIAVTRRTARMHDVLQIRAQRHRGHWRPRVIELTHILVAAARDRILIMVILRVLIGGLVVAMYLPIFKLGSVV